MTILELLTGRKADESPSLSDLAESLVPRGLPAHLATLELSLAYRTDVAALLDAVPGGELRVEIGRQLGVVDTLIARQQIASRMRAAITQRDADQSTARKRLTSATKAATSAAAAQREAQQRHEAVAARLGELDAALQAINKAAMAELEAAREQLDAAVLSGDRAEELAASQKVAALQSAQMSPSAEAASLALRIERTQALSDSLAQAQTEAAAQLAAAQRERCAAQIEVAKVECDNASERYVLELLQVIRCAGIASQLGFRDLVTHLEAIDSATLWMGDHRRGWFAGTAWSTNAGHVQLTRDLRTVAAALDGPPLDLAILRPDLRPQARPVAAVVG